MHDVMCLLVLVLQVRQRDEVSRLTAPYRTAPYRACHGYAVMQFSSSRAVVSILSDGPLRLLRIVAGRQLVGERGDEIAGQPRGTQRRVGRCVCLMTCEPGISGCRRR